MQQQSTYTAYNKNESWIILSGEELSIKNKIENIGTPIKDWGLNINRGILTGFNDAFIISGEQKNALIAEDPKSAELIRPILRGRDIKRYEYHFADLWLIATFPSRNYNIDEYPAIKKFLLSFGKERLEQTGKTHMINGVKIKSRKKTNNKWFETQDSIRYWNDFLQPKIVYREISDCMNACIVQPDVFINNKCYMITGDHLIYLISILNSTLFNKVILQNANTTGGKGFSFLKNIRIPIPPEDTESKLIELYNKRKSIENRLIDQIVDSIVYDLYGLSAIEKKNIEEM